MKNTAETLFNYLRDVIYDPANAALDVEQLPEELREFGEGLRYFAGDVLETTALAKNLSNGNLDCPLPPSSNELVAPLKTLHATLRHLTWQAQQVANGDYGQQINFMGDFSEAFNHMVKELEQRSQINLAEIVRARQEAEHSREIAERASRAKSDFLARMSHEMRTPMNAIIGMTNIYNSTDDSERKNYCVEKIGEASRHLLDVINDVLDMSNLETDKLELYHEPFNIKKMMDRIIGSVLFQIEERRQQLSVSIDDSIPDVIQTDEQRLTQVITNLLSNAIKFTPPGGDILFRAERVSEENSFCRIKFIVKDTGIGISKQQQEQLFIPFEQIEGGVSRKYGGVGLGLAISKRIVEMMQGDIRVESEPGKGASFIVEILAGSDIPEKWTGGPNQDAVGAGAVSFAARRILLAEDVDINREIVISMLENTGAQIDWAEDGLVAYEKFAAAPDFYDLILMDIHMPNVDGYEAAKRIRSSGLPGADTIPIIALTANVFREDIERCFAVGMNGHLGKPIDFNEIIALLKEYLP